METSQHHQIFANARVYTSHSNDTTPRFAECIVVQDGIIQHVGAETDDAVAAAKAAGARVRDMQGRTMLPGFIDGHLHLLLVGQALTKASLDACTSLDEIRAEVAAYARAHPELPRIFCRGWTHSMTPDGVDASMLDDLDARPIFIDTKDLHSTWCNSAGLRQVCDTIGLGHETPDPPGGTIQRGQDGRPNGVFNESAVFNFIWPFVAKVATLEEKKEAIQAAMTAFSAAGYTGMIDMAMEENIWEPLMELRRQQGELSGMRVAAYWLIKPSKSLDEVLAQVDRAAALAERFNAATAPDCRVVGIKVICDGIIDACTASLTEPYCNGQAPEPIWQPQQLHAVVARAHQARLQVALHAIGDKTITMAIDALQASTDASLRPRIEHLELASLDDAPRLGRLGITASIQPVHSDPAILQAWPRLVGATRYQTAFAYGAFADGGAPLALGSDAPTAPHAPLPNIYVATTRRSFRDPQLQSRVNPEFALSACQAIAAATHGSAYSCFADQWTGRLQPGLMADFVVCHVDLTPDKLVRGVVCETWYHGRRVYCAIDEAAAVAFRVPSR
ncbi:hypothetical protein CDD81_5783 [Ophiocordyceps australis]|uniref:Amidohydrolase 3 domain-containing protein n=1 Tax=Ophiocordyceps australis TaxID=1399860 RepID=A0A2C5Y8C0_9HYPO|nr:hypothetical protein CDD81_5783 [Ophiocordyceps australis]